MAIYRTVSLSFWTDTKVIDDFTPEDRYFYLYLFTNPHTNLAGCYEVSTKQMAYETGYSKETVEGLLVRFSEVHGVCEYSSETKEVLLLNWHKYNWTNSEKFRKPLKKEIENIKTDSFREYLTKLFNGEDVRYRIDTKCIDTTVTVTDTVSDTVTDTVNKNTKKNKYGEYRNVLLTDKEFQTLQLEYGEAAVKKAIKFLDEYIAEKGYKSKNHYLAIKRWVMDAIKERQKSGKDTKSDGQLDNYVNKLLEQMEGG
jgi:hypothetical protein